MNFTEAIIATFAFIFGGTQQTDTSEITVNMDNISNEGPIIIALFENDEGFPKEMGKAHKVATIKEYDESLTYTFEGVPHGEYAISIFQDENENGELDSNFIGFPKEPVGATNMTGLGKPSFGKCKFRLDSNGQNFDMVFFKD